jgi:hypothetical protein
LGYTPGALRIVFLDFDGVLNTIDDPCWSRADVGGEGCLDPEKVRLVTALVRRTGALVVLSTSWRLGFAQEELEAMLRRRGFEGGFAGTTPREGETRGEEIQAWLRDHGREVTRWVALDDATQGMEWLGARHVRTTLEEGLTEAHVEEAVRLLSE